MGGVNSQVRLSEAEMEAAVRDLRALLGPLQVAALASSLSVFASFPKFW